MPLNPASKKVLQSASSRPVTMAVVRIRSRIRGGQSWLDAANVFLRNYPKNLPACANAPTLKQNRIDLQEYLAASAPLHCLDGWAYLGRAIDSHIRSNAWSAVHLGYYAELRAAMSLLASVGIGVLNQIHVVLNQNGEVNTIENEGGTHRFAWEALRIWSGQQGAADLLGGIILGENISLGDWLEALSRGYTRGAQAREWLPRWGLDLQLLGMDQRSRNIASYNPSTIQQHLPSSVADTSQILRQQWEVFAPIGANRFGTIDRFLVRLAFEDAARRITGTSAPHLPGDYLSRVERVVSDLGYSGATASLWTSFLSRNTEPDDPKIIQEAFKKDAVGSVGHHVQVMARAALLLRVATGAAAKMLHDASFTGKDLAFWWHPIIETSGLWEHGRWPNDFPDMWDDVQQALDRLNDWELYPEAENVGRKG